MSKKRIGITCTTVFHYIHFHRIAEELERRGYEVEYIIYTPYHINNRVMRLIQSFKEYQVPFYGFEELFLNKRKYDVLLAPYYMPGFQLLNKDIKKIRLLYGYAKDRWNYAEWNKGFDLVLSYGDYATQRLSKYTEVVNIGHPRQRDKYKSRVKDIRGQVISKSLFNNDRVLLYCPTWADLSSLQVFMDNVKQLTQEFKVIVKLHHGNILSGNNGIWESLINEGNVYLFDEFTDLFDLLQFADLVLSDYSGAIFDAMLFKIPIVLLDVIDESITDTGVVNLNKMQNISVYDEETSKNMSLDIKIRKTMPHIRQMDDLLNVLKNAYEEKKVPYLDLLDELYSYQDNKASERGAEAIINLINTEKNHFDDDDSFHIIDEEKLNKFLKSNANNSVNIWGAGLSGQIILAFLQKKGVTINRIMDIDQAKVGKELFGLTIEEPVLEKNIIITVTGDGLKQIQNQLIDKGLIEGVDYISIFKEMD